MHLLGEFRLGLLLFVVLAIEGGAMMILTRRFLQIRPEGSGTVAAANCWNTAVLLVFTPLVGLLLVTGVYPAVDATRFCGEACWLVYPLEIFGVILILGGCALILFAFVALRENFQPGGFAPRDQDRLITTGIFGLVQHPLFGGVLAMTLGLALAVQSLFVLAVFVVHLVLVLRVMPMEEVQLSQAFGGEYQAYRERTKRLIPFVY